MGVPWATPLCRTRADSGIRPMFVLVLVLLLVLVPCLCSCVLYRPCSPTHPRAAMALSALSGDEAGIVFGQLCNALEPRVAVAFSSVSHGLWEPTQAQRQELRVAHEAAAALCHEVGLRSC